MLGKAIPGDSIPENPIPENKNSNLLPNTLSDRAYHFQTKLYGLWI